MKIISDYLVNNSFLNSTNNKTLSFENQSFVVFHVDVDYGNSLSKSPQHQYQKHSKTIDNESDSLPIPWIAAIIINAILVFLFIAFVLYCYYKTKKRRQRTRNSDRDSLFSSKSSKHCEQEVQNDVKISPNDSTNDNIFSIEKEHKKLTQNENIESIESLIDKSSYPSMKSPITKIQSVNRLASGGRGGDHHKNGNHYNPTDSPTVSQFTNHLNNSVPNQPQYKTKYEQREDQCEDQTEEGLEPLAQIAEDVYEVNDNLCDNEEQIETKPNENDFRENNRNDRQNSPSKTSNPIEQMPSSPSRRMSPSISTATKVMSKVKGLANSPQKNPSTNRKVKTPGSSHSSRSTGVQTSPNTSWANIPGAVFDANDNYSNEGNVNLRGDTEKKYFLYIIKDVNPYTKKECVGRVTLPARRMTLEQLRYYLLQSEDETIRNCAKRKFKFLSESYRLVVMNESFTPVDQVYQTQGIFIKFSAGESLPFAYKSKNKIRAQNRLAIENESKFETKLISKSDSISRFSRNSTLRTDNTYDPIHRSTQRKDSIYGNIRTSLRSNQKSIFGSTDKISPNRRDERSYVMDRTPKRRDGRQDRHDRHDRNDRELLTTSQLSLTTSPMVSPMLSPRTRVRLCRKMQAQAQVESGQLEEMPNFFTSSVESICDNPDCYGRPLFKCWICTKVSYCSLQCKRDHWNDHRFVCKKPPWKG